MWAFLSKVWYHRIKLIGFGGISIMNEIVELISKYNHCTHLRLMFTIRLLNDYFQKNAMNSIADDTRYKTICSHLMQDENIRLSGVTSSGLNFYKVINSELLDEELLNSINEIFNSTRWDIISYNKLINECIERGISIKSEQES